MSQGKLNGLPPQVQQMAQQAGVTDTSTQANPMTASAPNKPDPTMAGASSSASAQDMMAAMGKGLAQQATVTPPEINQQPNSVAPDGDNSVAPVLPTLPAGFEQSVTNLMGQNQAQEAPPAVIQPAAKQPTVATPQTTKQLASKMPQPIAPVQQPQQPQQPQQQQGARPGETYQDYQARISGKPKPVNPYDQAAASDVALNSAVQAEMIQFLNGTQYKNQLPNVRNPLTGQVDNKKLIDMYNKAQEGGGMGMGMSGPVKPQQSRGSPWQGLAQNTVRMFNR